MPDYGTPKAHDAVARVEKAVNAAFERIKTSFPEMQQAYPRAVGSQPVHPDEEFMEFTAGIADNPEGVANLLNGWRQQHGDGEALKMLVDFVERNEKRLGRIEQNGTL